MTIPHVSIVSSSLLAGSNPSAWRAVASGIDDSGQVLGPQASRSNSIAKTASDIEKGLHLALRPVYRPPYKTSWPWNRGSMKASWIRLTLNEYPSLTALETEVLQITASTWLFYVIAPTMLLLLIPSFLGAMIRYVSRADLELSFV